MQALASVSGPLRARQAQLPRAAAAARAGQGVAACHALMRTPRCRGMQRGCVPGHVVGGRRAPGAPSNDGRATRLRPRYSTTRGSPSSSSCSGTPLASAMPAGRHEGLGFPLPVSRATAAACMPLVQDAASLKAATSQVHAPPLGHAAGASAAWAKWPCRARAGGSMRTRQARKPAIWAGVPRPQQCLQAAAVVLQNAGTCTARIRLHRTIDGLGTQVSRLRTAGLRGLRRSDGARQ